MSHRPIIAVAIAVFAFSVLAAEPPARPDSRPAGSSSQAATATAPAGFAISVDRRVELISIVFRLAGHPEYGKCRLQDYAKDIDTHFAKFKDHPAVALARKLRAERGISYDAPMSLAVHLTDLPELAERTPLDKAPEGLDSRWKADDAREFLKLLRDFAKESDSQAFFDAHAKLYQQAAQRMEQATKPVRLEWFNSYYGQSTHPEFRLYLGLTNGPQCYGPHFLDKELYCILGVWEKDADCVPAFSQAVLPTVIHEFNHSYVNPVIDAHAKELEAAGQKIFVQAGPSMRRMAYSNWKTMLYESVVRAGVVRYRVAFEGAAKGEEEIRQQEQSGFKWIRGLSDLMAEYEKDRKRYPTLDSFSPRLAEFFKSYAEKTSETTQPGK